MRRLTFFALILVNLFGPAANSSFVDEFMQLGIGNKTTYQENPRGFNGARGSLLSRPLSKTKLNTQACSLHDTMRQTDRCINRSALIQEALQEQIRYLRRIKAPQFANSVQMSKAELEQTIQRLGAWNRGNPQSLAELFYLEEINFNQQVRGAKYTGYITPALQVKRTPDRRFRIPIYTKPKAGKLPSHAEISRGALAGKGLEVAWTDDPISLYFAQIQGAANAIFPDGSFATLVYAGNNGHPYRQVATYLRERGYKVESFGNESIRQWLRENPDKIEEVLVSNPRFVFFHLKQGRPKTASGSSVIPWHTVAVDDRHIPLGSVLLAELPLLDENGQTIGSQWQLLFAQDKGGNIKGHGRIDLYIGPQRNAEQIAQKITGFRRTFLLRPKTG